MGGHWTDEDAALIAQARGLEWQQGDRLRDAIANETKRGAAKAEAAIAMRREPRDLARMVQVCDAFPDLRRRYDLTFAHHIEVLKLATDDERDAMLAQAGSNGWCARQTRRAVLALRIDTGNYQPVLEDDPVDAAMRRICQAWNRAPAASREMFLPLAYDAALGEIDL